MADRWFRLPDSTVTSSESAGDSESRPQYVDRDGVDGWSGSDPHPNGAPLWVVHVFGTTAALDSIASESDAQELSDADAKTALDVMATVGPERSSSEWNATFAVGAGN